MTNFAVLEATMAAFAAFVAFPVIGIIAEGISPIVGVHPEPCSVTVRCYWGICC